MKTINRSKKNNIIDHFPTPERATIDFIESFRKQKFDIFLFGKPDPVSVQKAKDEISTEKLVN